MSRNRENSERYWNERTQKWECGNDKSERHGKAAKDQSGKPSLRERIISRLIFGGPDSNFGN